MMMKTREGVPSQKQCSPSTPLGVSSQDQLARAAKTSGIHERASSPNMTDDLKMRSQEAKSKKKREVKSALVDHLYHDYANHPFQRNDYPMNRKASSRRQGRDLKAPNFPAKLHRILSTPEYEHIIAWLPHGRSWAVINKELLISVVLKDHFSHNNFKSFNRQINIWGFKRLLRKGPDYKSYYHQAFLRERPDLVPMIQRLQNEGKRIPDINAEPNFYDMPFLLSRQATRDGVVILPATSASANALAQGSAANDSSIRERAGSHQPFEQIATASSCSQNILVSTAHFRESQASFSQAIPTLLSSLLTDSVTRNPVPIETGDLNDTSYKLNSMYHPHGDQEFFASKRNVRSSDCSLMDSAYQFPSAIVQPFDDDISGHEHGNTTNVSQIQEFNQRIVKSAVSRRITSYSTENITSNGSTTPSFSRRDTNGFERGVVSRSDFSSESFESEGISAGPNQEQDVQTKSTHQNVPLPQRSIALLSNPPKDPVLEEFAKEYLPHFGDMEEDS